MPAETTHGDIHTGDVSGTFVVGDNNRVTNTTRHPEQPQPQPQPQPQQQSSAEDQAAVFAVQHGTMHVTYNAAAEREAEG
ncbi:hypothetical protein [Actinacidiphila oryziradicis]|uniref:Uncharacterized protein n=1 Tax=Actinacidiphila oryziradicis TaxID=2571141 RepID=A0A4U0S0B6_9ACTN|nr:hypothetical protein [Actinacidiphila oryziradicis]TKA02186.1 hypothetical protein FCI23_38760 [Actinacidiphila oryziradicis]